MTMSGTWADGDAFLLVSDALAAWLLDADPAVALSWTASGAKDAIRSARSAGALTNDDATLVRLIPHAL